MQTYHCPEFHQAEIQELELHGGPLVNLVQAIFSNGTSLRLRARGSSMEPFIRDGDLITIIPLSENKPGIGNVTAFIHPDSGNLVVHRIIRTQGQGVLIKGDNEPGNLALSVLPETILGVVRQVERNRHKIHLGIGIERFLIAWLSRLGWLIPLRTKLARFRNR
jgi:hypothetical protein